MSYLYLALAIAAEVAGTSLLKATEEFTKLVPTTFLIIFYAMSFWLMTLALRDLPLGVVVCCLVGSWNSLGCYYWGISLQRNAGSRIYHWNGFNYFWRGGYAFIF